MKVVLLKKVNKLGETGEIKEVSSGFASNYLIPQGIAKPASEKVVKQVKKITETEKAENRKREEEFKKIAKEIDGQEFIIKKKAEGEKLFGSVKEKDVAQLINKKEITEKEINFKESIKKIGNYKVKINILNGISTEINLIVKAT